MALVSKEDVKGFLRVDFSEDDELIMTLIEASKKMCMDVARTASEERFEMERNARTAVMYATAYMYEHREEADYNALALTLRAFFPERECVL